MCVHYSCKLIVAHRVLAASKKNYDFKNQSQAASQNCIGAERFLVHSSLYESFVSTAKTRVEDLQLGDVLSSDANEKRIDVGAMVTDRLFDSLERLIRDAVDKGARCLVGGKRANLPAGHYFEPTLLVDVSVSCFLSLSGAR